MKTYGNSLVLGGICPIEFFSQKKPTTLFWSPNVNDAFIYKRNDCALNAYYASNQS